MTETIDRDSGANTLRVERHFDAPPDALYRYFTEPEHLVAWFGPKDVSCRAIAFDARVGGEYELLFLEPNAVTSGLAGRFLKLEPPTLIQMTWRWKQPHAVAPDEETLVTIRLSESDAGTRLALTHERFGAVGERDRHGQGWASTLDCLDELLAQRETLSCQASFS